MNNCVGRPNLCKFNVAESVNTHIMFFYGRPNSDFCFEKVKEEQTELLIAVV